MNNALRRAAYHEAGHAVARHVFGWALAEVSIARDGTGICLARGGPAVLTPREQAARTFVALAAGIEAEQRLTERIEVEKAEGLDEVLRFWAGDAGAMFRLARLICHDQEAAMKLWWGARVAEARALVTHEWPAVDAIARALIRRHRLSSAAATSVILRTTRPNA